MGESSAKDRAKRYILVADNNVDDRFETGMILQRFGYNICTAGTAGETIEFMHVAPPAAVIAEALIGVNLAARLKKDARFSDIPIIALAKAPDLDLELRTKRQEFAACLVKPLDVDAFYQTVQLSVEKTPRKNIRIGVSLEAMVRHGASQEKGHVTVISEFGMFIRTREPRPLNERVDVDIRVRERTIALTAVVLYSYSFEASPFREPGMGMKFVKISPEDRAYIKIYILEEIREGIL